MADMKKIQNTQNVSPKFPPGPRRFSGLIQLWQDTLPFLLKLTRQYGDLVRYLGAPSFYLVNHPDYVKHVLQETNRTYSKELFDYRILKQVLGKGLVTSENPLWLRQRRLIQPTFHRKHIGEFGRLMTEATLTMLERWHVVAKEDQFLDIATEMMRLTLEIVGKALFGTDIGDKADTVAQALKVVNVQFPSLKGFLILMPWLPLPSNLQFRAALKKLDEVVLDLIEQRRQQKRGRGDLLSMLLLAQDAETGQGMDNQQLRDEVMTLLIAGHETTANALSWTWYLLSKHPLVERRLHAELTDTLNGRTPTVDDLPNLQYTRMVLEESMRLYPPVWGMSRISTEEDEIDGYLIPAKSPVFLLPYTMHRHPGFWENPERFNPERFTPERSATRHPFAYFPFGGGPRLCIGNNFAMMELQLVLATVAQYYKLDLVPGHPVEPEPRVTLRPRYGLLMTPNSKIR